MKVEQILLRKGAEVATIDPDATVATLIAELAQRRIGALVVSRTGRSVDGIVSERDIVRALNDHGAALLSAPVSQIMTVVVQCAPPTAKVSDLMGLMTDQRFRHVPVVDEDGAMIGIVSIGDIVKHRLDELQGQRDALIQYVTNGG